MGFVADLEPVVLGLHEEAHVEVQVGRLAATGRNPVCLRALCAGEEVTRGRLPRPPLLEAPVRSEGYGYGGGDVQTR